MPDFSDFNKMNNSDFDEPTDNLSEETNEDNNPNASMQNLAKKAHEANIADGSIEISKMKNNSECETVEITGIENLSAFICENKWSQGVFKNKHRNLANFVKTDLIALDIDNDRETKCTIDEAKEKFAGYKHIIASSRNHQKVKNAGKSNEKPAVDRFRVVLFLEKTITDVNTYTQTWLALEKQFPFVDPQTKDAGRFWYKCSEVVQINEHGNLVPVVDSKPTINTKSQTSITKTSMILPQMKGADYSEFNDYGHSGSDETVNDRIKKFYHVLDVAQKLLKMGENEKISNINIKFFSPIGSEKTASLNVDKKNNSWKDFSRSGGPGGKMLELHYYCKHKTTKIPRESFVEAVRDFCRDFRIPEDKILSQQYANANNTHAYTAKKEEIECKDNHEDLQNFKQKIENCSDSDLCYQLMISKNKKSDDMKDQIDAEIFNRTRPLHEIYSDELFCHYNTKFTGHIFRDNAAHNRRT